MNRVTFRNSSSVARLCEMEKKESERPLDWERSGIQVIAFDNFTYCEVRSGSAYCDAQASE